MQLLKKVNVHIKHGNSPVKSCHFPQNISWYHSFISLWTRSYYWSPDPMPYISVVEHFSKLWTQECCQKYNEVTPLQRIDCTALPMERPLLQSTTPSQPERNHKYPQPFRKLSYQEALKHHLPKYLPHQHWKNMKAPKRSNSITFCIIPECKIFPRTQRNTSS